MSEAWNLRFQIRDCFTSAATSSRLLNQKSQVNQSESFSNFAFKATLWLTLFFYSMLSVSSKIGRFVKPTLFSELALPSWLRHILYNWFDSSPPVIKVMIFIPTWQTIRWRIFNIPKRILVSTYMLIASAWKLIAFEYENNETRESNNHTKRLKCLPLKRHLTETLTWVNNLKSFSGETLRLFILQPWRSN